MEQDEGASFQDRAVVNGAASVSAVPASVPSAFVIEELLAHLGAARMQMLDTDDRIICGHIHSAHALALALFRGTRT